MATINLEDWLFHEQGAYGTGTDTMDTPGGPPTSDPNMGGMAVAPSPGGDPNITNPAKQMAGSAKEKDPNQELPDVTNDPQTPDMPSDSEKESLDFERWKKNFIVESIKGDVQTMKMALMDVRDRELDTYQHKFVEDNYQIILLRESSNIEKASTELRKEIKSNLDQNNPASSIVNHMITVLQKQPLLNNCFIKMTGLLGSKSDAHRKFIAGLTGSVQVGNGAINEDLILNEKEYSARISTRFNSRFGEVHIGQWCLRTDDPARYLKPPELKRLEDGSPEEKDVLRRRIVMESIADTFKTRAFIINVVGTDGTIYTLGWDIATSLKEAYTEGKLVVRTKSDDSSEAMITDDGEIVSFAEIKIMYIQNTREVDEEGKPEKKEIEFISSKYGQLFLTAQLPILREASTSFQGIILKEMPWQGNPSDLLTLRRCVPSLLELLLRTC
jgi:hypothetical protein